MANKQLNRKTRKQLQLADKKSTENFITALESFNPEHQEQMMFVYHNEQNDIQCISGVEMSEFNLFIKLPLSKVVDFLEGKSSPSDYFISEGEIKNKVKNEIYKMSLKDFLTERYDDDGYVTIRDNPLFLSSKENDYSVYKKGF